jgi:DNA-binding CsgD family transcriptional regulator
MAVQFPEPGKMSVSVSLASDAKASPGWAESLARAIDSCDRPDCLRHLITGISALVEFDLAMCVVHELGAKPVLIHDTFKDETARLGLANYLENTYVLNPVYTAHQCGLREGVYRIGELAPDAYLSSEHYRAFKVKRMASEEIGYVTENWPAGMEELVLAIDLPEGRMGEVSLSRAASLGGFDGCAIGILRDQVPVIGSVFRLFWRQSLARAPAPKPAASVEDLLGRFGTVRLSPREREVAQLILKGHSGASIAVRLGISETTVKSHRQNLYAKLGIASQFELFSEFLKSLSQADGRPGD